MNVDLEDVEKSSGDVSGHEQGAGRVEGTGAEWSRVTDPVGDDAVVDGALLEEQLQVEHADNAAMALDLVLVALGAVVARVVARHFRDALAQVGQALAEGLGRAQHGRRVRALPRRQIAAKRLSPHVDLVGPVGQQACAETKGVDVATRHNAVFDRVNRLGCCI